jgi:hypothetical protein
MMNTRPALALLAALVGALALGCGDIDNAFDCNGICDRYKSCFDSSYNTSACYNRCQARGTSNNESRRVIDTCAACIGGLSCAGAVFTCAVQCSSVVP